MSRNRKNQATYDDNRAVRYSEYVYGNAARALEPERRRENTEEVPVRKPHHEVRKNRDKARYMNAGYVVFLVTALCAAAFILVNYIQLQSQLTNMTKSVAAKKSELNYMSIANDEEYNRIISSINLEEIQRIAVSELGMVYAGEGQIIEYENKSSDYMRQVTDKNQ